MKLLNPVAFIISGVISVVLPEFVGYLAHWRETGDSNLIVYLSLVCWPAGAALSTLGFVKLIQRDRKPAPGQTAKSVLFIFGGLIAAWQAWSAFEFMEDASAWLQIVAYAAGAIALIALGIRKATRK